MISLSSTQDVVEAMRRASDIALTAYELGDGAVSSALAEAAARGARVRVRLEGYCYGDDGVARVNADAIERLGRAGADAQLVHRTERAADPLLHLKAALVDGALFLDDSNWRSGDADTIVYDDRARDARMVRDAASGRGDPPTHSFATCKRDALALEAALIAGAHRGDDVVVASESFGRGNSVYDAIDAASLRGARVRLMVSSHDAAGNAAELTALARLARDGVDVRLCDADEKFAAIDGARAWIGSANATASFAKPDQLDWGMRTSDRGIVAHLRSTFERRWHSATSS